MNDKELNLCEILKDCPKGTRLWSPVYGNVYLKEIKQCSGAPIRLEAVGFPDISVYPDGRFYDIEGTECIIYPSKESRDWSTWKNPKQKVERFDPKTFEPFDKVLVREDDEDCWLPTFISYFDRWLKKIITVSDQAYSRVIPYNDDTKHLIGTCDEAPEYYRYWEN